MISPTNKAITLAPSIFVRTTERTLKKRQKVFVSDEESRSTDEQPENALRMSVLIAGRRFKFRFYV